MTFYPGKASSNFVGTVGILGKAPGTGWPYIQPKSRTEFNWAPIDEQLADMKKLGMTNFIYLIGSVPGWAVANHAAGTGSVNKYMGQWVSVLPPDDMADYTNFVHALLTRYPQIKMVYNWCEPQNNPIPVATAIPMDRALIDYVHAHFPGVLVGSPTIQPRAAAAMLSPGYWYYDYWTKGGPKDFDVLLWHGYPGLTAPKPPLPSGNTVEVVAERRANTDEFLKHFGLQSKPVWDEESSWEMDSVATRNKTDTVAFVSQDLLMHWSFGDEMFVWYGGAGLACGTLATRTGGALNPAGVSWNETHSWMLGATLTAPGIGLDGVVRSGTWTRPGGYSAISVWTGDGSTSVFKVPTNTPAYLQYRDTTGNTTPITGTTVPISGRPIWIETQGAPLVSKPQAAPTEGKIEAKLFFSVDGGKTYTETQPVLAAPQVIHVKVQWNIIDELRWPIQNGVMLTGLRSEESDFGSANCGKKDWNGKPAWSQRIPTYWVSTETSTPIVYPVDLGARPEGVVGDKNLKDDKGGYVNGPLPAVSALAPGVHKFIFRLYYRVLDALVAADIPFQVTISKAP